MPISAHIFKVSPSSGVPIFRQIIDQVIALVAAGKLQPGDMLPSTRDVAGVLEVNMMTVSKAYSRLESQDVAKRIRGRGMQICEANVSGPLSDRKDQFQEALRPALHRGWQLGLSDDQILTIIHQLMKEKDQ